MDQVALINTLLSKRADYDSELLWHRFLLDAFAGTGGFEGKVRMPFASFWGAGADMYGRGFAEGSISDATTEAQLDTYLDRFHREDIPKFIRRASIANYCSPVEKIVDIRLSYLSRKPWQRDGIDTKLADWMKDCDGFGTSFETLMRTVVRVRGEVVGYAPVLVDMPEADESGGQPLNQAQADAQGLKPRLIPLLPANLYDWSTDERGGLTAIKVVVAYEEREDLLAKGVVVRRVSLWTAETVRWWEIVDKDNKPTIRAEHEKPNPWGVIPLAICRHRPSPLDRVRGMSGTRSISKLAKRLLNYTSEIDEHLRSSTFALLQVPVKEIKSTGTLVVGPGNAVPIPHDSTRDYKYISPDASVCTVYEKRIAETKKDISSLGSTEFTGGTTGGETSGAGKSAMSRSFEFENMNRSLAETAAQYAAFEQELLRIVARMLGLSDDEVQKIVVIPPTKFEVEEMAREIEETLGMRDLKVGPTATGELLKRLVRLKLPGVSDEMLKKIDAEIDDAALQAEQDAAAARELAASAFNPDDTGDPNADPNDPNAEPAAKQKVPPKKALPAAA